MREIFVPEMPLWTVLVESLWDPVADHVGGSTRGETVLHGDSLTSSFAAEFEIVAEFESTFPIWRSFREPASGIRKKCCPIPASRDYRPNHIVAGTVRTDSFGKILCQGTDGNGRGIGGLSRHAKVGLWHNPDLQRARLVGLLTAALPTFCALPWR